MTVDELKKEIERAENSLKWMKGSLKKMEEHEAWYVPHGAWYVPGVCPRCGKPLHCPHGCYERACWPIDSCV